jgi:hydrogenase maturation protein HypF
LNHVASGDLSADSVARRSLRVTGTVQGVGFRPFVYRLAQRFRLTGEVYNDSRGVLVDIEGTVQALNRFTEKLLTGLPELARVDSLEVLELKPQGTATFLIAPSRPHSEQAPGQAPMVPADAGICQDCLREISHPGDRRFGYPFANCTNCGPRYSIIRDAPYDRALTTMAGFRMCSACHAEYENPCDRRFHAEPNACPACGPQLTLVCGETTDTRTTHGPNTIHGEDAIARVRDLLAQGLIVAIKGVGGFHLACDAMNDQAVRTLRERKRRADQSFALMIRDTSQVEELCVVTETDRRILESPERPILLLRRKSPMLGLSPGLSPQVAPGNARLGVMLPYSPLHYLLFGADLSRPPCFRALVMTSGNLTEEPMVSDNAGAMEKLSGIADAFLLHDRDIETTVDDSVAFTFRGHMHAVRRSRGYAPQPIPLGRQMREVLATGGQMKNTFCLTKGHHAILSQHIGDLGNLAGMALFEATLRHMKRFFRAEPVAVAHDLHPAYSSTHFAGSLGLPAIAVQHHHAHIVSCMAEHHLDGEVIGLAMDGTGYGTDGNIWGGEVLQVSRTGFHRHLHLRNIPLAGGDAAVREVWRSGLSCVLDTFGSIGSVRDLPLFRAVPAERLAVVITMLERGINTVQTSSCGRLFDAVAALLNLRQAVTYEGQAAVELESLADRSESGRYGFEITDDEIDMRTAITEIVADQRRGIPTPAIAARFHNAMAAALAAAAVKVRSQTGLHRVCLSGGTFQNLWLLDALTCGLEQAGFEIYTNRLVPANDGGLSLGQATVAAARLR